MLWVACALCLHLWHLQQAQHAEHKTRVLWPHGRLQGTVVPGTLDHAPLVTADLSREAVLVAWAPGLQQPAWALVQLPGEVFCSLVGNGGPQPRASSFSQQAFRAHLMGTPVSETCVLV